VRYQAALRPDSSLIISCRHAPPPRLAAAASSLAAQRWSSPADRQFHDALFSGQRYYPFTFAYPGYVMIRRFADLAEARFDGVRTAVDLGCGPGEITCELARRRPEAAFTGVDHSEAANARGSTRRRCACRTSTSKQPTSRRMIVSKKTANELNLV
jgi:SAM-dependent methyltransferase